MKLLKVSIIGILLFSSCDQEEKKARIDWILVQGGSFEQGKNQVIISPKGDTIYGFTSPQREVQISDFQISRYEITVAQFKVFCEATGRKMPDPPFENAFGEKSAYVWEDDKPMLATWHEADEFARWAGGRLPTEAEWEYAAKGGQKSRGYQYSGSDNAIEVGWVRENSGGTFHKVGLLKPNELGLHDMTGNVGEWVHDWYNPEKDHLVGHIDPAGPPDGEDKISKGVSWYYGAQDEEGSPLRFGIHMPEVRYQSPPDTRNDGFGFRVAKDN